MIMSVINEPKIKNGLLQAIRILAHTTLQCDALLYPS